MKRKVFQIEKVQKYYICSFDKCNKKFTVKGNYQTHVRKHTGERPFICKFDNCGKGFITQGNLNSHMVNHTGLKPYFCSDCGKQYAKLFRLKVHQRTHTGQKPFKCPYKDCEKSFNEKGNLKTHIRIHTGEKPFICKYPNCNQAFKAHGHLSDHKKRHNNERPYGCLVCKAKFSRSSTLKIHMKSHTEIRQFKCPFKNCERTYSQKGNLNSHISADHFDPNKKSSIFSKFAEKLNDSNPPKICEVKVVEMSEDQNNDLVSHDGSDTRDQAERTENHDITPVVEEKGLDNSGINTIIEEFSKNVTPLPIPIIMNAVQNQPLDLPQKFDYTPIQYSFGNSPYFFQNRLMMFDTPRNPLFLCQSMQGFKTQSTPISNYYNYSCGSPLAGRSPGIMGLQMIGKNLSFSEMVELRNQLMSNN